MPAPWALLYTIVHTAGETAASCMPDRIEPVGQGPIEKGFGPHHIQAVLFRNEGKVCDKDTVPVGHKWTGVDLRRFQHRQHGIGVVEEGFTALYLGPLAREIIREHSQSPEVTGTGKIIRADPVTPKEVIRSDEVKTNRSG